MKHWADRATRYAEDVVNGRIPSCKWVRLSCQRHLDDLAKSKSPDYPYEYNPDPGPDAPSPLGPADRVCAFIEYLPHVKGKWIGKTIELEGWQCFVICIPFGWVHKKTGLRRFREAYWEVARKNAKSTISAGVGNYMLCADREGGAEVYSGATTEKQAWEVFGPARLMAKNTPPLQDFYGVGVNAKTLVREAVNAKFEPVIGNPGDGSSPHMAIVDEYHEHKDSRQRDTMKTGMGSREQPMLWTITTAGFDTSGPCYQLRGDLINVLRGTVVNEQMCGAIWTVDEGDEWTAEESLRKANPNMGVSVFEEYLLAQQQEAINSPRLQSAFKTKHLNVWVGSADPFFNTEKWHRLRDETLKEEDFAGESCWFGVDLAAKYDLAVTGKLYRRDIDGEEHFYWFPRFYLPEGQVHRNRNYDAWCRQGHIIATAGEIISLDEIEGDILKDAELYRILSLGYDPHNCQQLQEHLTNEGVECVEVPQTTPNLSDPMKWTAALIEDGRIHHAGNPVMDWCIDNVTAKPDRNENVFPRKEHRDNKIDGAVALIIAKGQSFEPEAEISYLLADDYDEHFGEAS